MTLDEWRKNRWLDPHEPTATGIAELLDVARVRLEDTRAGGLSPDARAGLAYSGVLAVAAAALAAEGYRAAKERHHERLLDSLRLTIGAGAELVQRLHRLRRDRNVLTYERIGVVSVAEADRYAGLLEQLTGQVKSWLRKRHPEL